MGTKKKGAWPALASCALANRVFAGVVGKIQFAAGLGSLGFGIYYASRIALQLKTGF